MVLQISPNSTKNPGLSLLSSVMIMKAAAAPALDIAALTAVLLTAEYCAEATIAPLTDLIANADNVTIDNNQVRIDVVEATNVSTVSPNDLGKLVIYL